jgi:hypothetical protein
MNCFGLILLFILSLSLPCISSVDVTSSIYTSLNSSNGYCIRLLSKLGTVGCSTAQPANHGTLRLINQLSDLDALMQSSPDYSIVLVVKNNLINKSLISRAADHLFVSGVIILYETSPTAYSPELSAPQLIPSNLHVVELSNSVSLSGAININNYSNSSYQWNPAGDGLLAQSFNFAIIYLISADESSYIYNLAVKNEQLAAAGDFAYNSASLRYFMYAQSSSQQCLLDKTCIPVGGFSVWGLLGNNSKPITVISAALDSSALFHQLATGATSDQSGVITLLAIAKAFNSIPNLLNQVNNQFLFTLFNAESFSHAGSRRFLQDLCEFKKKIQKLWLPFTLFFLSH